MGPSMQSVVTRNESDITLLFSLVSILDQRTIRFICQPCMFFLKTRAKALDAVSGKGAQIRIEMIPIRIDTIPIRIETIPIDDPDFGIVSFQISSSETETLIFI